MHPGAMQKARGHEAIPLSITPGTHGVMHESLTESGVLKSKIGNEASDGYNENGNAHSARLKLYCFALNPLSMRKILVTLLFTTLLSCTSTYYIVRHADKTGSGDVPLNALGQARAETLRDTLKDKKISSIYSTSYLRTQQTAQPTADHYNKAIITYSAFDTSSLSGAKSLGKNRLIVGHSNTVPQVVHYLGGTLSFDEINEDDFDNLIILKRTRGLDGKIRVRVRETTYGASSP